jgi:hypothetical protein
MRNITSGQSVRVSVLYHSSESSAEWIEEMPSTAHGSFIPLSDFGTTRFLSGSAVVDGVTRDIAGAGGKPLVMINPRGEALAAPSVLDEQGGFAVSRSPAPAPAEHRRR